MPGLTAKLELELLEDKVEKLVQRIIDSNSLKEKEILTKEYHKLIAEIIALFKILNKTCI